MKTVYILGAGASAADGAPTIKSFLTDGYQKFHDNDEMLPLWSFLARYYHRDLRSFDKLHEELPLIDEVISTIDWAISNNISLLPHYDAREMVKLRNRLVLLMSLTLKNMVLNKGLNNHDKFVSNLDQNKDGGVDIISLNYDLLVDDAIRKVEGGKPVYYGFSKAKPSKRFRLYKLHGSLNWAVCPFCRQIEIKGDIVAHNLFSGAERCPECRESKLEPVLVTPTILKSYNIPELPRIWNEAFQSISQAEKLVFIGYSLPPADFAIIELFKRAIHFGRDKLKKVHIIDYSPTGDMSIVHRYEKIFGKKVTFNLDGFKGEPL